MGTENFIWPLVAYPRLPPSGLWAHCTFYAAGSSPKVALLPNTCGVPSLAEGTMGREGEKNLTTLGFSILLVIFFCLFWSAQQLSLFFMGALLPSWSHDPTPASPPSEDSFCSNSQKNSELGTPSVYLPSPFYWWHHCSCFLPAADPGQGNVLLPSSGISYLYLISSLLPPRPQTVSHL